MLYVIPLLLLLVVLVLLKVRSNKNKDGDSSKKTAAKKTATKSSKKIESSSQPSRPVTSEKEPIAPNAKSSIDEKFRANIEQLIASRTFHTAEAKINQALNQDNSQHELYLYLVDIHLAQNDDFAIKQLLNYIRSLGLDDIAAQAEEKQRNYVPQEIIETRPKQTYDADSVQPAAPQNKQNSNKAFDALIIDNHVDPIDAPQTSEVDNKAKLDETFNAINFYDSSNPAPTEKAVEETTQPETKAPEVDNTLNIPPLEFNFDVEGNIEAQSDVASTETTAENISEQFTDLQQDTSFENIELEFNVDTVETAPQNVAAVETPLDFNVDDFQFDSPTSSTTPTTSSDLEFDSLTVEPPEEEKLTTDTSLEFALDVPNADVDNQTSNTLAEATTLSLDNLDAENPSLAFEPETLAPTPEERQDLDFDLASVDASAPSTTSVSDLEFTTTESPEVNTETTAESMPADPLVQTYPHVTQVDEVELDLQLAARYIELGAFESAKILLARNASKYTAEQREISEKLLNKIAS